jgi:hypothetical protein
MQPVAAHMHYLLVLHAGSTAAAAQHSSRCSASTTTVEAVPLATVAPRGGQRHYSTGRHCARPGQFSATRVLLTE